MAQINKITVLVNTTSFFFSLVGKEKIDLTFCHDPEKILDLSLLNNEGEAETQLVTEATFVEGSCANKFSKKTKPRIFYISNKAITYHNGIPSVAAALKQCLAVSYTHLTLPTKA